MPSTPTVLVIGASGFVGRRLATLLLAEGRAVRCVSRDLTRLADLAVAGCEVVQGDMLDATSMARALDGVQAAYICVHTLAPQGPQASGRGPMDFMDLEKAGVENIICGCRETGVRRLVYVTSIGVAPDAPSAWVRGRSEIEERLFASGLDVTVLRPGMIVGRGGAGFDAIARGARGPTAVILGSGRQRFRPIAVDDLAYYLVGVLDDERAFGRHYDVGSDDILTTGQMIDLAAQRLGRRPPIKVRVPARVMRAAAPLVERASKLPRGAMTGLADSLSIDMTGDPRPIRALLTRAPQPYREAVEHALG